MVISRQNWERAHGLVSDGNLARLAGGLALDGDAEEAVRVDVDGDLDQGDAAGDEGERRRGGALRAGCSPS